MKRAIAGILLLGMAALPVAALGAAGPEPCRMEHRPKECPAPMRKS